MRHARLYCRVACCVLLISSPVRSAVAAQPPASTSDDFASQLPRVAPLEPAAALASFAVPSGFELQQVAAEPLVADPVAAAFDADGALYVVEMRGYSEERDQHLSRVRKLTDADGDGRFDTSTEFVTRLLWPTALLCYEDGLFVADPPDIYYFADRDGDGRAEHRQHLFTGFSLSNVQGLLNSFRWGLDQRVHVACSSTGGTVRRADRPDDPPYQLAGHDFAFDPRTLAGQVTVGGAQHGMTFDDWGTKFLCSNSDHLQQVLFDDRYLLRNPQLVVPAARQSIAADGPQAEVFRLSPVEPWRVLRTRLRVAGAVPGPVEGGGRAAGYFTSATGVTGDRGHAWPAEFHGQVFIGDVGSNIVHRKRLVGDGLPFRGERIDQGQEFLAARDIWFRPVQFLDGPDGNLYVLDMYREVIEHPASLPPAIKEHLDLTSGHDRGRVYRLVPTGFRQPPAVRLRQADTATLVATLSHPNGWHRDTASRLLYERRDTAATLQLRQLVADHTSPLAALHALHLLDRLETLDDTTLLAACRAAHPRLREHALRLAEPRAAASRPLAAALAAAITDADRLVRFQAAFSLGELSVNERLVPLVELLRRDAGDSWLELAALSSLANLEADAWQQLVAGSPSLADTDTGQTLGSRLLDLVARRAQPVQVAAVLSALDQLAATQPAATGAWLLSFGRRLPSSDPVWQEQVIQRRSSRLAQLWDQLLTTAAQQAVDNTLAAPTRAVAIEQLGWQDASRLVPLAAALLGSQQPHDVQLALLRTVEPLRDGSLATQVADAWPQLTPAVRRAATDYFFTRDERLPALLAGIQAGSISPRDLDPARLKQLREHPDSALRESSQRLLADVQLARRADVVAAYQPALQMTGDPQRGREAFRRHCAACHKLEGHGQDTGPNLATLQNRGPETILLNVLDPNREVNPQYVNYTLQTTDGRTLSGLIAAETATSITLRRAEGAGETILRAEIETLASTGLSLMPEGLEQQLSLATMADLLSYLGSLR